MIVRKSKVTLSIIAFLGVLCTTQVKASRWLDLEETVLDTRIRVARTFDLIEQDDRENYARKYLNIAAKNLRAGERPKARRNAMKALDQGIDALEVEFIGLFIALGIL